MPSINHNILPTIQGIGVILIVLFSLIVGGKIDQQQAKESEALNAQIKIDSAIDYINSNANLGTDSNIQDKLNEAIIIYSLDSLQVAQLEMEYYL